MKKLKKILSVLALVVLVWSDFLTSISYALDDMLDDSVVVQIEKEEAESVENEDENMEEEKLETENSAWNIIEEWTWEVSEIGSWEVEELTEETVEWITWDVEWVTWDVEELTWEVVESTEIWEEIVIEDMTYNEQPIIWEKSYNDVTVKVEALSWIFPEWTELNIEPIKWWNLSSLKDKLVEEKEEIKEDTTIVAFDITFRYEWEEVQPKNWEKVKVTFDYSKNEDLVKADKNKNQEVKVYHIEDKDEEWNKVAQWEEKVVDVTNKQESTESWIAVADAESFSVYLVTYGNEDPEFFATLVWEDSARNNFHYKTISISDGENTYTLMDRNLWARVAWNTWTYAFDDKSNYNTEDDYYGYYYQWWNNYGFSNIQKYGNVISDAIPSNYVSSSWSTSNLGGYNLRWDTTNTESARQWPCPRGWHVPSANEWEAIKKAWCMSYNNTENCQWAWRQFAEALQMPTAGYRYYNYGKFIYSSSGSNGYYWSSTSNDNSKANYLFFRSSNVNINTDDRVNGLQVRCLKNNTDAVTLYLNPNGGRVEDAIIDADEQWKVILPTATRNEYNFDGWYDAVDWWNRRWGSWDEITINEDTDLYAHWSEIIPNPIVTFNNGANVTEFEVESGWTLTNEQVQQILNLTHTKATFDGWYKDLEFTQPFDFNTIITEDISLYAKWTCKEWYITLQWNGWPDMNCFEYETISYEYDGNKHILMDRNLWAQMIWFGREADLKSYGYYYQWWNNYGFGPFTTPITSNTQVDCANINPSTYSRSTFITWSSDFDWCSPRNDNLWWWNGDGLGNNRWLDAISATVIDRQWPCPRGWHVPSAWERQTLLTYWVSLNGVTRDSGTSYEYRLSNFTRFSDDFKMPLVGRRAYEGAQLGGGGSVYLWSSSPNVDDDLFWLARHFNLSNTDFLPYANSRSYRAYGMPVRCFMNNPKTITFNYNGWEGENFEINVPSWTKVTAPADPTNGNHIFAGWYEGTDNGQTLSDTAFDFNEEITQNVDLYAKWVSCENWEIYAPESWKCVARWHELVSLTDDTTTTTVWSDEPVDWLPTTITVIENNILELPEWEALSEAEWKELVWDITIDFGWENAKFSRLVKVKIPVEWSSKAYVKVKHVWSTKYNFDWLTTNTGASCDDGDVVSPDDMYHWEYMNVESGYVSIYTCEASDFAAFGLPKVTFEPNNGSGATVVEVENGATVNSGDIPTVTKEGYNFSGWYLTWAESAFDFSGTTITGDITLYAKWQEDEGVTYTVSFDTNRWTFADTPASQNVLWWEYATDPATFSGYKEPELPWYAFTGWWTEPRDGTQWDFANDVVTGNITLYAHWEYEEIFGDLDVYLISSTGAISTYVMMDRNLWATGVYNKNFDSQNPSSFGFVYQWWNNYGFPRCNGNATCNYSPITDTPVSVDIVENYIPSKFASSIWIWKNWGNGSSKSWHSNSGNVLKYLWWNGNTTDMQWPCPDGYHVPLASETNNEGWLFRVWGNIYDKTINTITGGKWLWFTFLSYDQELFSSQFLFPHAWNHKKGNTKEEEQNMCWDYWTATPSGTENAINMWFCKDGDNSYYDANGNFLFTNNSQRNNWSTLRCFKNSTSSANLNIVDWWKKGLITVEKVGGVATINAIKVPENTDASWTDLIFDGWYTSPTFESNTMKTWGDTLSDSVTALYAKWNCPDGSPYNSNNQCALWILVRFMDGETEYTRSIVLSWEEVSAPATNPEKSGYNFLWWFESWANSPFVFTGTPITWDLDLYAHWDINNYDVNASVATWDEDKGYLSGMWSTWISLTWLYDYGTELVFIAIPELGYVFDYWMNGDQVLSWTDLWDWKNQLTVTVDQVLDIIAFFKETPTAYTVEHYQQNLSQTWYDFVWSGIMYWIANEQTNATGTNYTWFTLSWNLADYQMWINADWSTVVRLYYNRVSVVSYLVSFNADRWTFVSWSISQSVASWTLVTPLTEEQKPVFPWYRVDGWYKTNPRLDSNAEEWIFDQDVVTGDITLYAHWTNNYDVRDLDIYFVVDDSTGSYYTTLDRDVWASQLWVAWYQYQWWNNHWFKACTTSKCNSFPGWETTSTNQVDVSDYDPISNPYSSNIYIIQAGNSNKESNWAIGNVNRRDNLWWWVSGTNAAMQWPCPEWYHIPTSGDWEDIYASWSDINFWRDGCKNWSLKTCATKLVEDLLLTPHGRRDHEAKVDFLTAASYWSSSPKNGASTAYGVYINSNESTDSKAVQVPNLDGRIRARAVRCVKNEYNTPLIIKINWWTWASLSVYSWSLHYLTNPTKEWYEFSGWYSNLTGNVKIEDGSTLPQGTITLYAKWISNNEAEYIFNASWWIFNSTSTEELVHVYTLNDEINSGDIETPIRTGYNFLWWYDESGEPVSFPIVVTWNLNLYAHWEEFWQTEATITVNHHWMNIGGSWYTIHETEYISWDIGDEFTATEKEYTWFTADPNNEKTIIISGDNNIIDLYYYRHWWYFYFLMDQFSVENITISGCDNGTCWYGEDVQLTVQEATWYTFNSWGIPTSITLPEWLDRTQKTLSFTMPEISDMQIRWSISLTAIPYTITYHLDGWEEVEHNQTGYTAWDFLIYVTDPVKTGYDFLWWTWGVIDWPQLSSLTTWLVIVVRDMYVEVWDREYYANWSIKNYEVDASVSTWDEGYLSGMWTTWISLTWLYDYATELVFIAIPELGYVFDYWKNWDTVLSGTDLWDGTNQLTVVVDQILDIIAFFKPSENTPYTVEHYKQNLDQTWYEFAWSGTMYGTTNEQTNATGTDYEWFTLSWDLVGYQTWVKADWTTIVRLYYNRNTYTVTRNMWDWHLNRRKIDENVPYWTTPIFEWDDEDKYTPKRWREVDTDDIKYDFTFTWWVKSWSSEIIKDLTTQIVTGDVRYIAQYDTGYRYYEVRYHTDEWTWTMEPQSLQLYSSWTLNKNKFIRTGYIFSGWWYEYGDGIEVFYEDEQEINLGVEDDVIKSDAEWEDPLYLDVYAQWKPSTGTKVTVNYYLKDLDADNNVLIDTTTEYATWVEFTWTADSFIDSILTAYGTWINGYEYSTSIVYGPDYPDWVETWTTTILADWSRVIDMYYVPSIYQFTLNSESHSSTAWSSESTWYYYGANVRLSGDSNDDCFTWSGWTTTWIALSDNTVKQTLFTMPANDVEVTPSVRENTYNIIFNGNGNTSWEMLPMNGVRCTESTWLTLNSFRKIGYHFTGWSKTSWDNIREYTDRQTVSGLSKNDWENINLYAVWDANPVSVHIFHLSETLSWATMRLETGSVLTKVGAFYSGEVKTFPWFTYNPEDSRNKTWIIASYDGSVNEILLYYKRNQYPVRITNEWEWITNEATGSGDYLYEEPVTISVRLFTWWEFVDWTVIEWDLSWVDLSWTTLSFNMPAEQVRISPNLNHILYTVSFDAGLWTAVTESQTYYYDDVLSGLDNAITTRTGYDFSGWYLSGVLYTSGSTMPAENITLTAVWDINKYDVSANVATWGEGYLSGMWNTWISLTWLYDFWESLVVIAIPELGYLFDYWEVNWSVDAETWNQLTIIVDQILDIVAHFKENVGTVTVNYYNMNTWWVYSWVTNTATFTWLIWYTGYATMQPPIGFHLDTTSTVNTWIVISENNAENVINIYYARNKHNITLWYAVAFLNPGSVTVIPTPRESGYYYWEDVHFEAIVSTWYVFKQWRVNGISVWDMDGADFVMWDEDVELVVDWDLINYNIDYYTEPWYSDPMNPNPQTYTVLSGEIEIHNPIAEFCNDFLWWTWGTTWDWILTPTTWLVIDSSKWWDRKYYTNWEWKSYEVELSVDPSSWWTVTWEGTYRCMGEIELHATPNTWYHFVGWYDTWGNIVSSNSMYFFRGPVGSLWTWLTAKFERNQYYITIDKNGSWHFWWESAPSGRYYHGTPITFIASPSYGYKIQKWTKNRQNIITWENDQLYTWFILDVIVTETGNYEVYFEPETYNIIYMDSGRVLTWLSPATYTVENHVYSGDLPSITKDGYTFAWWFYEYPWQPEYQIQEIWYVPVDGKSVTILAWWMPIDYYIHYHLLTWVEIIPWEEYYPYEFYQSYNIETERTNLPEPQKSGYVFSWWIDQNHNYLTWFGWWMTWNLDLYPTWKSDVMGITVNYYEMDTNGEYPYDPYHEYPTQRHYYTWFTNSTFTVPDYSKTGFNFQYSIFRGNTWYNEPVTFEVSENESENIINVYYQRSLESFQLYSNNWSKYSVSPDCWSNGYGNSCWFYYGTEITINNYIYEYDEWYSFSGWNIDSTSLPDDAYLSDEYITFSMPDHSVVIRLETNHILYKLTFTWYEWAEVMNYDSTYASLTGENYYRFDTEIELPYLNKPWYNFVWWNEWNSNVWSVEYTSYPYHPIWNMPSHDVELTAVFEPRTDMEYYKYYYFQDTEWTGYSLSWYDRYEDGITDQRVSSNCNYVEWFTHSRGEPDILYIKATWDNYINCYYDRDEYMVDVIYDDSKLSISWTWYYRYEAPVNLTATVKTWYEFSGFSSEWPEYNTTDSTLSFNVPLWGSYPIYAYAKPIVYSIEYEMYWWWLTPYQWYITGYTVDWDYDLGIFDAVKDGYTFLWWTWGEIWVREVTEPTKWLVIPLWSIWNRKYFANFQPNEENVVVNYYLKKIDAENNTLTWWVDIYLTWVVFTWLMDDVINISGAYLKEIEWYHYDHATVYSWEDEITAIETTILANGSREINMYYIPNKYNFTLNSDSYSSTEWSSESTWYYYGATVRLSGDSNNDCYIWSGWITNWITLSDNTLNQTWFTMPANNVIVTPSVREMTYNIVFSGNGSTSWEMSSMMWVRCTESTWLILNSFQKIWYRFTGWSTIPWSNTGEYTDWQSVSGLSKNDWVDVNLYAVWDIDWYTVTFDLNGWSLTWDMTETKDYTIETPEISLEDYIPVKTGYNFSGWYKGNDLTNSIAWWETWNYTLTAKWEADSDTEFKVEYYLQNVEDDGYTFAETGLQTGTTNTTGYADITKEFTWFIFSGWNQNNITSGVVVWDGSLVLKLYYDRKEYNVTTWEVEHGIMEWGAGSQRYGKRITFTAHPDAWYVISKWLRDGTKIISGWVIWTGEELEIEVDTWMEIGVEFKAKEDTPYYVEYYKEKLEWGYNVWTWTYSGTTDQEAIASELIFTWFTYDSWNVDNVTTWNIDWDGSRVLVMYYTRNINNVVYVYTWKVPTGQVVPVASGYKYESNVTVAEAPSVSWYNFSWNTGVSSFIMPDEEVTITGTWTANTWTKYAVKHMLQNVEDDEYTQTWENQILSWETDELTDAQANNYTWFVVQAVTQTWIRWDESTVVEIYYDREIYGVTTWETEHGSVNGETGNQRYGKVITFTAHPEIGYILDKWFKNGEEIISGWVIWTGEELEIEVDTWMEISAEFKAREDTPYYVEYYKENLEGWYDVWTWIQYGTSDTEWVAEELIFTWFTYDSWNVNNITTWNIDWDGSKVLKMYYNREIYTITWLNEDWTDMDTTTVKYGEIPTHADPTQPADTHYTYKFKGWDPEPTFATGEISYRATYEHIVNKHTITWKNDDGSLIDKTMVEYGTIPTHAKPTKTETEDYRYIFARWDPEVAAVVWDAEYTAVFNAEEKEKSSKWGGMSGWWGRWWNIDSDDNQHWSAEENIDWDEYTWDEVVNDTDKNIVPLYKRIYENNITTMDTLENADPDWLLTRWHLAKMVVNYMVNVLWRKIPYDVTYNCRYWGDDESSRESDEIRDYATKACAFWVMWINMEDNKFLPNSIVTRAEFWTVMSRVLRWDKYDITDTDNRSYYENHLQALKKDNILTQIANPEDRWEIRKWVWLVFRRIVEKYKK